MYDLEGARAGLAGLVCYSRLDEASVVHARGAP